MPNSRPNSQLRRQIAKETARLVVERQDSQFAPARAEVVERLCQVEPPQADLPTHNEIRVQIRKLAQADPNVRPGTPLPILGLGANEQPDRFRIYEALLVPLELVEQNLKYHPEGDALYHSLQVFDHARDELPYDEEFLVAALLHDVGKGIDVNDHVAAGLVALEGTISERTAWLIEHHMLTHDIANQTIGSRVHRRLRESEYYDDLVLLGECDRAGRQPGVEAPELEEAIEYLRELEQMCG